ncbi:MAG: FAD binding domain-containing protein, partial [Deltaproteobacteria bacterium]|nr:FAD binding domain-containing protein [Deltaproteobacteria bacterium]
MLRPFLLEEPGTVAEASALLARYEDAVRVYAGGTELLLAMKEGFLRYERLINIKRIPGLDGVTLDEGRRLLRIGPLTTHRALSRAPIVRERLPELAEVEDHVGNIRVRTVGTLGGNLCFAEPHADPGTFLLLCDAEITLARAAGQRTLPLQQFITGPYETALEPDELLTEIRVPLLPPNGAIAYRKFGFLERPSIGVGVA